MSLLNCVPYRPEPSTTFKAWASETPPPHIPPHLTPPHPTPTPSLTHAPAQVRVKRDDSWAKYMMEGMDVGVLLWNGKVGRACRRRMPAGLPADASNPPTPSAVHS
jgi:hypothetical protein